MIAGTLATMAVSSGEMSQFASWAAAIIVGGGTAGVVQMSTVAARGVSTATTGGLGNLSLQQGSGLEQSYFQFQLCWCLRLLQ